MIAHHELLPETDFARVSASVTGSAVFHHSSRYGSAENVSARPHEYVSSGSLFGHDVLSGFF